MGVVRMGGYNKAATCCMELGVSRQDKQNVLNKALSTLHELLSGPSLPPAAIMPFVWIRPAELRGAVARMIAHYGKVMAGPSAAAKTMRKPKSHGKAASSDVAANDDILHRLGWPSGSEAEIEAQMQDMMTPDIIKMLVGVSKPAETK